MPIGLISGGPTPRPRGSQAACALTTSYRRTSASVRGTPTLNCTVSTTTPGRETDITCSTPVIWLSACSAGVVTICSTSRTDAPANGTNTLAIVTLICGSSSRGVTSRATTPSSRMTSASSGVICALWKYATMRPDGPRRSLSTVVSAHPRRSLRIERDAFARGHAAEDLDLAAGVAAGPHLAQQGPAVGADHVHDRELGAAHQRLRGHEEPHVARGD